MRRFGHLLDGPVKGLLVCLGGPRKTTQLPDKLQGGRPDLGIYRGRLKVMQGLDVPTHDGPLSEKHFGWVAEKDLADGFVMRVARLDLLRDGVDVAEAALKWAAGEDRIDAGGFVGPIGDLGAR